MPFEVNSYKKKCGLKLIPLKKMQSKQSLKRYLLFTEYYSANISIYNTKHRPIQIWFDGIHYTMK